MTHSHAMHRESPCESIALIGMAGRFPGADDVASFWNGLVNGLSGVTDVVPNPTRRSKLPQRPNYVAKAAVVKDADWFDAKFFGIYPKQAVELDPQHRVFLEMCWHAIEDAGYVPDATPGRVGVFAGCHMNTYIFTRLAADADFRESMADSFPGGGLTAEISNDKDYLATRVAYHLNLRGPCVAVQSACSTSLVAIAQACESLIAGSCDMAISGGVTVTFPQEQGYLHTEDSIISPDGTCRTFDADAKGTVFGDGVGVVVLKRLSEAIADRDDIYAVIKGWGVNNDGGDKNGYTAPSVSGQSAAIKIAHQRAGITADTISYVEAHGTGTLVGDPIEVQALTEAFRETTDKTLFCRIGSLKTNVGHLDVAAGVTGVIKTSLALKYRTIPPILHFNSANPKIDFANSPFIVNTTLTPWNTSALPRRAGVSSFGVGGTNAHLVLEEAPEHPVALKSRPFQLLQLSAKSVESLELMTDDLVSYLEQTPEAALADVAFTLQSGRKSFRHKRTVVVQDSGQAIELLRARTAPHVQTVNCRSVNTPLVMMFPGQGSQHLHMARELYDSEPVFANVVDACAESLMPHLGVDLRQLVYDRGESRAAERLNQTEFAQPALFMISFALGRWWQSFGVAPQLLVGHSVGEFAAAALAGVMSMQDAARLVALRGRLMQSLPAGAMLAVQLPETRVKEILPPDLEIAAINGPAFCVVSGPTEAIEAFAASIESGKFGDDVACRPLKTSHAFHSRMMDPAIEPFELEVQRIRLNPPAIPIVSTVTCELLDTATATDPLYWARQIREPVCFSSALASILKVYSNDLVLLEAGPSVALSTLARQQPLDPQCQHIVSTLPHANQQASDSKTAFTALGRLWQQGVGIDWNGVYQNECRRRVHLPKYRFQRERYSFETELGNLSGSHPAAEPLQVTVPPDTRLQQMVIEQQMQLMNQQMLLLQNTVIKNRPASRI